MHVNAPRFGPICQGPVALQLHLRCDPGGTPLISQFYPRKIGKGRFFHCCKTQIHLTGILQLTIGFACRVEETDAFRLVSARLDAIIQARLPKPAIRIARVSVSPQEHDNVSRTDGIVFARAIKIGISAAGWRDIRTPDLSGIDPPQSIKTPVIVRPIG